MRLLSYLGRQSGRSLLASSYGFVVAISLIDYLTGTELALSIFYFLPIALSTYFVSRRSGLVIAVVSALAWLWADLAAGHTYDLPLAPYWNALTRLVSFVVISLLLAGLRRSIEHERQLARTDYLTGAANQRCFCELLTWELKRARRSGSPFTVAHFDIDNFKSINDTLGHHAGNDLLCLIVKTVQSSIREVDVMARLGGDEFAILLPETDQEKAQAIIQKVQQKLMATIHENQWPITFSIGVLTCLTPPHEVNEILKMADELTYSVKNGGKNGIRYGVDIQHAAAEKKAKRITPRRS